MHYRRTSHDDCAICGSGDSEWTVNPIYVECLDCQRLLREETEQHRNVHSETLADQANGIIPAEEMRKIMNAPLVQSRQVGGTHYKDLAIEPWDVMKAWKPNLTVFQFYLWGNALKYLARLGRKGEAVEDLDKAIHYLQKLREELTDE